MRQFPYLCCIIPLLPLKGSSSKLPEFWERSFWDNIPPLVHSPPLHAHPHNFYLQKKRIVSLKTSPEKKNNNKKQQKKKQSCVRSTIKITRWVSKGNLWHCILNISTKLVSVIFALDAIIFLRTDKFIYMFSNFQDTWNFKIGTVGWKTFLLCKKFLFLGD